MSDDDPTEGGKWTLPNRKVCNICGDLTNHNHVPHDEAVRAEKRKHAQGE